MVVKNKFLKMRSYSSREEELARIPVSRMKPDQVTEHIRLIFQKQGLTTAKAPPNLVHQVKPRKAA